MRKIQPVGTNVLIELVENDMETTASGIVIPDTAKEKPQDGKVIAVSPEAIDQIQEGDVVIFKPFSGTEIEFESKKYLLVPDSDILAKYVEADEI